MPRQQLLGQHRECCALRGNGWGKKHSTVDYVFKYTVQTLVFYHSAVMDEMQKRGYKVDGAWRNPYYRGKNCATWLGLYHGGNAIFPEHNDAYLQECIDNLAAKGVRINAQAL